MAISRAEREQPPDRLWTSSFRRVSGRFAQFTSWSQSLFRRNSENGEDDLVRQFQFPNQKRILDSMTPEGFEILEGLGLEHYPLPRKGLQDLLQGKSTNVQQEINGHLIEAWRMHRVEPVRLAYSAPFPDRLMKVVGLTGFDSIVSSIFDRPEASNGLFYKCTMGEETFPMWDSQGRAYPPDDLFKKPMAKLAVGETATFSSKDNTGLSMHFTRLPIKGKDMPRVILASEEKRAKNFWRTTLSEARRKGLDLLFFVKLSHLGIAKAYFWGDLAEGQDDPRTRILIRDSRINYFGYDNKPLGGEPFFNRAPGHLNVIIEYSEGDLEALQRECIETIRTKNPLLQSLRSIKYTGILASGLFDITETGGSLARNKLGIVGGKDNDIFQCPPGGVWFTYEPNNPEPNTDRLLAA